MNKSEKIIVVLLGLLLVGYLWNSFSQAKKNTEAQAKAQQEQLAAAAQKPAPVGPKAAAAEITYVITAPAEPSR